MAKASHRTMLRRQNGCDLLLSRVMPQQNMASGLCMLVALACPRAIVKQKSGITVQLSKVRRRQNKLGVMYFEGDGVPKNEGEAAGWIGSMKTKATPQPKPRSGFSQYSTGKGVPQNYAEAAKWLRLAAKQGFADCQRHYLARGQEHQR